MWACPGPGDHQLLSLGSLQVGGWGRGKQWLGVELRLRGHLPLCSHPPCVLPNRYGRCSMESYRENLERVFVRMDQVLPDSCLLVWNMAMPLGERVTGGFLLPEASDRGLSGSGRRQLTGRYRTLPPDPASFCGS